MEKMDCNTARRIDLVDYLASLGHRPVKTIGHDHWYRSPLRGERTASFKVNRALNVWYDHGLGKGGNLIDFGVRYFNCSVAGLLERLNGYGPAAVPFFQPPLMHSGTAGQTAGEREKAPVPRIQVAAVGQLSDQKLLGYLMERGIPAGLAGQYCRQVDFEL